MKSLAKSGLPSCMGVWQSWAAVQKMMGYPKSKSVMAITSVDANVRHNLHRCFKHNHECRENDDSGNSNFFWCS